MSERILIVGIIAFTAICYMAAEVGIERVKRDCKQQAAEVLSSQNICEATEGRWVDLGDGTGQCISKAELAKLGVVK
jgi:hypothetical protein